MERRTQSEKRKTLTQNSKLLVLSFSFAFCALSFALLFGCQNRELHRSSQIMMGTFAEVISPDARAAKIAFAEMRRIEGLMSKYDENSEISLINKNRKNKVSSDTLYVIKKAKKFCRDSGGAFDITVAPLLEIWGFKDKNFRKPEGTEIENALALIGSDKIIVNENNNTVELQEAGMGLDLGAIAAGYAVDCAVKKLKQAGITSALINIGGDIYCLGAKFQKPWRVAVKDPRREGMVDFIELKDKAVSTSGDYEQFFIAGDKRYSHIFDPKTGYPIESGVISVTVVAQDCLTADALATSVSVLGKDKGERLAKKFNAEIANIVVK